MMQTAMARLSLPRLRLGDLRHWPSGVALGTLAVLYLFAALSVSSLGTTDGRAFARAAFLPQLFPQVGRTAPVPIAPPPVPEPLSFRQIAPQDAVAHNASIPVSKEANPAARPFALRAAGDLDRTRSLDCLTAAVYYEAAIETSEGQRAVAQVVLNRVRHAAFPKTVCGVVFQGSERSTGCQFTFTCDGSLMRRPSAAGWDRARDVAKAALGGKVYKPVGYATHYHTNWVVPYWSSSLTKLANVGTHIFYRWEGGWGRPAAFRHAHAGTEPRIGLMARLSSEPDVPESAEAANPSAVAVAAAAPIVTDADFRGRAVMRRYAPLREQAAANARADLARAEVPMSVRWALTGEGTKATAFGKKKDSDKKSDSDKREPETAAAIGPEKPKPVPASAVAK
jgi:spore germination cell wall hydrolase CwlJ-like protein